MIQLQHTLLVVIAQFGIDSAGLTQSQRVARQLIVSLVLAVAAYLLLRMLWSTLAAIFSGMRYRFTSVLGLGLLAGGAVGLVVAAIVPDLTPAVISGVGVMTVVTLFTAFMKGFS